MKLASSHKKSAEFIVRSAVAAKADDPASDMRVPAVTDGAAMPDAILIGAPESVVPVVNDSDENDGFAALDPVSQLLWSQALRSMH